MASKARVLFAALAIWLAATSAALAAPPYRLGAGDQVQITTFGEPSLSGAFDVNGAGMVDAPLIGQVQAEGLTTEALGAALQAALRDGFLEDPKVSVEVLRYRPFYILGEVTRPGAYPYASGLTVLNAVATANGFTYRADTRHVYIKHRGDPAERRLDLTVGTEVQPGDTIRIHERYFQASTRMVWPGATQPIRAQWRGTCSSQGGLFRSGAFLAGPPLKSKLGRASWT